MSLCIILLSEYSHSNSLGRLFFMPSPLDIFDDPFAHWSLLTSATDDEFEHQHLDRKEAGRCSGGSSISSSKIDKVRSDITECVSAFANSNRGGSILVLGISSNGEVKGINHLSDAHRNSLTTINNLLKNQAAKSRFVDCNDDTSGPNRVCLIYVPQAEHAICETLNSPPPSVDPSRLSEPTRKRSTAGSVEM
jgi:hypothetical protein